MLRAKLLVGPVIGLVLISAIAGCTSSSGMVATTAAPTSAPLGSDAPSSKPAVPTTVSVYPLPTGSALKNDPAKAHEIAITSCRPLPSGGQIATGTASNSSKKTVKVTIVVYFNNSSTKKPVNWASTQVAVPAGKSVPWVAEKAFQHSKTLTCQVKAVN